MADPDSSTEALLKQLKMMQKMVDVQTQSLKHLREAGTADLKSDLLLKERSESEGKLMRLFARQLFAKLSFGSEITEVEYEVKQYPSLTQFLYVVDITSDMVEAISHRCNSIEELCLYTEEKIRGIFYSHSDDQELAQRLRGQCKRLIVGLSILRSYVERLQNGEKTSDLVWTSWDDPLPESPGSNSQARLSIASYLSLFSDYVVDDLFGATLSTSSILSPVICRSIPPSPNPPRVSATLPRSKSDEASSTRKVHHDSTSSTGSASSSSKFRVKGAKGHKPQPLNLLITNADDTDSDHAKSRSSSMSQSPRTPRTPNSLPSNISMGHAIKHRFSAKQFLISLICDYCNRIMFIGVKCKECKFQCHKKCSRKAPPSCGLPDELEKLFRQAVQDGKFETFPNMKRTNSEPSAIRLNISEDAKNRTTNRSHGNLAIKHIGEHVLNQSMQSGGFSSTASSASSLCSSPTWNADSPGSHDISHDEDPSQKEQFHFSVSDYCSVARAGIGADAASDVDGLTSTISTITTISSDVSTDTLTQTEGSLHSNGTKSSSSTTSCSEECPCGADELHAQISDVIPPHVRLRDRKSKTREERYDRMMRFHDRGSLMSEWVIPYQDIEVGELIGEGRLGKVFKARWHGDIALKVLYLENPTHEEKEDFKYKVQALKRTRHENLMLFMGACMVPPTLALVCSLCKGYTLYDHIHVIGTKFDDNRLISIIQQTAQGMSYLHARGIVHKDLKSKNIFIENQRVVITDFGLLSVADVKMSNSKWPGYLLCPQTWICYQAPEIVRQLNPSDPGCEVRFYSQETDTYAFGTVWFELLAGTWPFDGQPVESIIWQIGKGFKQQLGLLEISREAKDILSMIWAYDPSNRPAFHALLKAFERLPKRKLIRSPSQPTYMTRSANALIL